MEEAGVTDFKTQLSAWQKENKPPESATKEVLYRPGVRERIEGGDVLWKPINREAAKLLCKSPWWAHPVYDSKPITLPPSRRVEGGNQRRPRSSGNHKTNKMNSQDSTQYQDPNSFISQKGFKVVRVAGQDLIDMDSVRAFLAEEISRLPKETRPNVKAAEDARAIINELLDGIGGDMERFRANTKLYLDDIRQSRMGVVTETAQITKALHEVRQFFLGQDYKEQTARLKEFVDLCERLQKLKESGFLDSVADTMLRLAN